MCIACAFDCVQMVRGSYRNWERIRSSIYCKAVQCIVSGLVQHLCCRDKFDDEIRDDLKHTVERDTLHG